MAEAGPTYTDTGTRNPLTPGFLVSSDPTEPIRADTRADDETIYEIVALGPLGEDCEPGEACDSWIYAAEPCWEACLDASTS